MILTTCAACATPIEYDAPARCVGCQTRYCSDRCLRYHAHRGGHDDECDEIKMMPVTQRVLGESHKLTLTIRKLGAMALYSDPDATLDDLRKAMNTLEEIERMARRVMGGAHPLVTEIERNLRASQDALARGLP